MGYSPSLRIFSVPLLTPAHSLLTPSIFPRPQKISLRTYSLPCPPPPGLIFFHIPHHPVLRHLRPAAGLKPSFDSATLRGPLLLFSSPLHLHPSSSGHLPLPIPSSLGLRNAKDFSAAPSVASKGTFTSISPSSTPRAALRTVRLDNRSWMTRSWPSAASTS